MFQCGVTEPRVCEPASVARFSPRGLEQVPPNQNTKPSWATTDRGCKKCVPLNVDRKLYSATLLVTLVISTEAVYRLAPSLCKRLSVPMPRLMRLRGFTRLGLWSSFCWLGKLPYPPCGSTRSFDVTRPCLPPAPTQSESGFATVANTPLHAKPIDTC